MTVYRISLPDPGLPQREPGATLMVEPLANIRLYALGPMLHLDPRFYRELFGRKHPRIAAMRKAYARKAAHRG